MFFLSSRKKVGHPLSAHHLMLQRYFGHFLLEIPKYSFIFYLRNPVPLRSEFACLIAGVAAYC